MSWIGKVQRDGTVKQGNYLVIKHTKESKGSAQVAIIVSARIGSAIVRNKVKRRLREILRTKVTVDLKPGLYLFIAKKEIIDAKYNRLKEDLIELVQSISDRSR